MDAYQILVIILSVTLAIFLLLAISLTIGLIKLVKQLNITAEKADTIVSNVESASESIKNMAGPAAIFSTIAKLIKR
jgi:cell division protein FtsB